MILAVLVAVRGDPFLAVLDSLVALACCGASAAAFSGLAVTRRTASVIAAMGAWVIGSAVADPFRAVIESRPAPAGEPRRLPEWVAAVARGLVVAVPLALIFAVLFASADPVFGRALGTVLGFRIDLGGLPGRVLFVVATGWLAAGLVSVSARGIPAFEGASLGAASRTALTPDTRVLGLPEALVILVLVDIVIAAVRRPPVRLPVRRPRRERDGLRGLRPARLLRAGRGRLPVVGRRHRAGVDGRPPDPALLAALIALIALTGVVLASAALRLRLYQDAYGWTELRLYVLAAIVTIGLGLAAMAALVLADRSRWIPHTLAVLGICSLVALNLVAPAAFVASQNVARVIDPSLVPPDGHAGLDTEYLAVLPDDAIPVLVEALPSLPPEVADELAPILRARHVELAADPSYASAFAWNLGRERARTRARRALPVTRPSRSSGGADRIGRRGGAAGVLGGGGSRRRGGRVRRTIHTPATATTASTRRIGSQTMANQIPAPARPWSTPTIVADASSTTVAGSQSFFAASTATTGGPELDRQRRVGRPVARHPCSCAVSTSIWPRTSVSWACTSSTSEILTRLDGDRLRAPSRWPAGSGSAPGGRRSGR